MNFFTYKAYVYLNTMQSSQWMGMMWCLLFFISQTLMTVITTLSVSTKADVWTWWTDLSAYVQTPFLDVTANTVNMFITYLLGY